MEICLLIVAKRNMEQRQLCDGRGDLVKGSREGDLLEVIWLRRSGEGDLVKAVR